MVGEEALFLSQERRNQARIYAGRRPLLKHLVSLFLEEEHYAIPIEAFPRRKGFSGCSSEKTFSTSCILNRGLRVGQISLHSQASPERVSIQKVVILFQKILRPSPVDESYPFAEEMGLCDSPWFYGLNDFYFELIY